MNQNKSYSWNQINNALMAYGMSARNIVRFRDKLHKKKQPESQFSTGRF